RMANDISENLRHDVNFPRYPGSLSHVCPFAQVSPLANWRRRPSGMGLADTDAHRLPTVTHSFEGTAMDVVQSAPYDLVLRGGRVIDPAQGLDGLLDVAVRDGRIAAIGKGLPGPTRETIDVRGKLVLPGMIDTHAHVYRYVSGRFGMDADMVGVHSGVTTVIDQGGPSCMTLPGFRHFVAEPAKTRVYAFLSSYLVGGLEG